MSFKEFESGFSIKIWHPAFASNNDVFMCSLDTLVTKPIDGLCCKPSFNDFTKIHLFLFSDVGFRCLVDITIL